MRDGKKQVLIVGGTGYLGKRLVKASLAQGHPTYVLQRLDDAVHIEKIELLLSFKEQGAHLVSGSFDDHQSLVDAVKLVDVVISAISGVHLRSHHILLQLKLVDAIKEAGNIKRFLPSEFGTDPARMENAMELGRVTFDDKMAVRKAIQEAGIPFTYVSANCFAGYFVGGLCQPGGILPSRDHVVLFGDGNQKCIFVDEDDIAMYTIKTIDDPRTLNKTLYLRPPQNILPQREVVEIWEKLIGKQLQKSSIFKEEFLTNMKRDGAEEASQLYPEIKYTTVHEYMKRYL
ncbi:Bifunctional pinoresinol-lariciresinol reductase 2 [Vitis vinifera]|uniref:(+)-lariciresinol reductase n=1 Tax=Vitis vinifera TaxID=29760 RepID=A0A438BXV1_VITVI|nr:Bifunctional pinoresinol-lariciresinol reductase 2 [Vitis vinifera]